MTKLFRKKQPSAHKRNGAQSKGKVHSYYTPNYRQTIDIDLSRQKPGVATGRRLLLYLQRCMLVVFLVVVAYFVVALNGDPIISLEGTSASMIGADRYSSALQEMLHKSVLNKNKITLQHAQLEKQMMQQFPEITSLVIRYSLVGRRPEARLSIDALPYAYNSLGVTYIVSEHGKNVGPESDLPAQQDLVLIKDESGVRTQKGDTVMTNSDVAYFLMLKKILAAKGRGLDYIRLTSLQHEAYIRITNLPYDIRLSLDLDPAEQIGTFFAAEKTLGEGGDTPTSYVDVRAGEKVYWK